MVTARGDSDSGSPGAGPVLGVDLGARRVGVAVSDTSRTVASGLETLNVKSMTEAVARVADLASRRGVSLVVVGLPLNMNGSEGQKAREARRFAGLLSEKTGTAAVLWDERLTSVQARGELGRLGAGRSVSRDKGRVDRVAATLLLQSYLDSLK
jgi:putative Holliday junction resolvase